LDLFAVHIDNISRAVEGYSPPARGRSPTVEAVVGLSIYIGQIEDCKSVVVREREKEREGRRMHERQE